MAEDYHWTPASQRGFLERLAETGSVRQACESIAKSARSAYNLRYRSDGAAFRLGWAAAILVARGRLADDLLARAIDGQEETVVRDPDAHSLTRHRHDNRLAMSMLSRLDRIAEGGAVAGSETALARIISQDFAAFLDLVERGGAGSEAALFIAARDPVAIKADGQCELAQNSAENDNEEDDDEDDAEQLLADMSVWADAGAPGGWRTNFPPPLDYVGIEDLQFGDIDYARTLTPAEIAAQNLVRDAELADVFTAGMIARDAHFGFIAMPGMV